jgi:hypothetical protein
MTLTSSPIIGLEQIQREAFFVLFDGLNDAITQIQTIMDASDQEFATRTGRTYTELEIEPIADSEFYEGHRPSLITSPVENYPNCSVWCASAMMSQDSEYMDHTDIFLNELYVEVMVKAAPGEDESVVNRRAIRTAEAAHFTLMTDQTLGGVVTAFADLPTVNLSEIFKRQDSTGYGQEYFWQAARLDYTILKESNKPSNSTLNLQYPSIDQA